MKVLHINAVYKLRSTGRSLMELHEDLNRYGVESYCACSRTYGCENVYQIGDEKSIKLHGLMSRLSGKQGYFSKGNTKKLIAYIDKVKPDVVHLHNLHANYIHLPMLLEYLAKNDIATVIMLYDCWFFTGKCMHYNSIGCYQWETHCKKCPQIHEGNKSWFFDRTEAVHEDRINLFQSIPRLGIVGISDWITDECRRSPIAKNAKIIQRIYLWIDLYKFHPVDGSKKRAELGLTDKFVILGVAEQWGNAKGLDRFLDLATKISPEKQIVLVGNPAPDVKLPDNVLCVGRTNSQEELAEFYSLADVFVTFSYQETFGKVSAEALACGTPVVCYNSTACPELVGENCGIVVEKNDKDGMLRAVNEIQKNGKAQYSAHCTAFARENFGREKLTQEFLSVYQNLLTD
ncbi:MAG: glycosyltransferase [Candidatus Fimenecus sp.]